MYMRGIVWSQFSVFAACEQPTASTAVSRLEDSAVFSLFSYLRIPHVLLTPLARMVLLRLTWLDRPTVPRNPKDACGAHPIGLLSACYPTSWITAWVTVKTPGYCHCAFAHGWLNLKGSIPEPIQLHSFYHAYSCLPVDFPPSEEPRCSN